MAHFLLASYLQNIEHKLLKYYSDLFLVLLMQDNKTICFALSNLDLVLKFSSMKNIILAIICNRASLPSTKKTIIISYLVDFILTKRNILQIYSDIL